MSVDSFLKMGIRVVNIFVELSFVMKYGNVSQFINNLILYWVLANWLGRMRKSSQRKYS